MSKAPAALPNLLRHTVSPTLHLDMLSGEKMKDILGPWLGSGAAAKLRKEERRRALDDLMKDAAQVQKVLADLPETQRQILALVKHYGGAMTGALLTTEATVRGLVEADEAKRQPYYETRKTDPILLLCRRLLLVSWQGGYIDEYYSGFFGYRQHYPDVALNPALANVIEPAASLPWPTPPAPAPVAVQLRSTAEVAFDLWTVAQALHESGAWKTNKGGSLPKAMQNRLHKALVPPEDDPVAPPQVEGLYYELLRGLDAVEIADGEGRLDRKAVERDLDRPAVQQSWRLVQAWLHVHLWQDGIGLVPDRDSDYEPVRIRPDQLDDAKELLVWALQRLAHGRNDWLGLSAFLKDLQDAVQQSVGIYWSAYSWQPELQPAARQRQKDTAQARLRRYWLEEEGLWFANALFGTLWYLGLVERGDVETQPCFRLTPWGQAVFAAPDTVAVPPTSPHFLTVQPNFEIVAYLNAADAATIWPLARMAHRVSTTSGLVQTFALTRDSVYQALESGLTLEQMQQFLRDHSTSGLPDNVIVSLKEWGRKREALTLRTGVHVLIGPSEPATFVPKTALAGKKSAVVIAHNKAPAVCWRVAEDGRVHVDKNADAVALARLGQFADADGDTWRITAESARRAHSHGLRAEQILDWVSQHADREAPPLLATMLRNWTDGGGVFLGELLLLQAPQEQAAALLREHSRFQRFFLAHVPPNWFIVRPELRGELERVLHDMGFATTLAWKPPAAKKAEPEKPARKKRRRR